MAQPVRCELRIYPDGESMCRAAAEGLIETMTRTLEHGDRFSIALSGGSTPLVLYRMLAGEFSGRVPWEKMHFYWGDERCVPQDDPRSNVRLFHDAVMTVVRIPPENIHPMPTDRDDPDAAAREYEALMRKRFDGAWPRFDMVLLGLGKDGHTASLFPGSPALAEGKRWVVGVRTDADPPVRVTVTLPVLNAASDVWFLVSGREKADALRRVMTGPVDPRRFPASAVCPAKGGVVWWVDEDAASHLGGVSTPDVRIVKGS
jgi:6-phosphogluconolactonase